MNTILKLRLFAHSWRSDWNHGNAHFLRGLANELSRLGHEVRCYEAEDSWSFVNLLQEGEKGKESVQQFTAAFPDLHLRIYSESDFPEFAERELHDADVVVVHEWNSPAVVNAILALKSKLDFYALFHDTHHRAYTNPKQISQFQIDQFDGVLAFGEAIQIDQFDGVLAFAEAIRQIYKTMFAARRSWTFHEAADTAHFYPKLSGYWTDVNWIGNWGDGERTRELEEFLIAPLSTLKQTRKAVYGVRYPPEGVAQLEQAGINYCGYLPNLSAEDIYAQCLLTLHIPRRCYSNGLSGVPTVRMFEALACGIPLVCSPWIDSEGLFRSNQDYICVRDGRSMQGEIVRLLKDESARKQLASQGFETIQRRHTCAHRAQQFVEICEELAR